MDWTIFQFLRPAIAASLIIAGIHAYLGLHVVERGVIFVDLSLAQIASLGAAIAVWQGYDPHEPGDLLDEPGFTLHRRVHLRDDQGPRGAHPAGSDHRHLLRRRVGGRDPDDEQGDRRGRAPQGHARRQHPVGAVAGGLADRRRIYVAIGVVPLRSSGSASSRSRSTRKAVAARGISVRFWDFLFYASFGFVVTRSVAIAGVLLVFCYLIVPSVGAMLLAQPASAPAWRSAG